MPKVLIVDDEPLARERLQRMLAEESGYEVVGEASSGAQALEAVQRLQPDIVLLDVRMPGMDGMSAAQAMSELPAPPTVIFCTAYDEYAIQAFDVQAIGYLLKPVRQEQLRKTLVRARLGAVENQLPTQRSHISATSHAGLELVPVEQISHFIADQKYVTAFSQGREIVLDESLKQLEQEFVDRFLRIHRNCLVSLQFIERLVHHSDGKSYVQLRSVAQPLAISRRHLPQVKKVLKGL